MKIKQNEFAIGLSVTIATLIVIFTILWLGKSNFLVKGLHLNMIVQDANGLSIGDEILYKGLNVGTIQDTEIGSKGIAIQLKIEKAPPLPKDSRFVIKSINLLGEMALEIIPGKSNQFLNFGDTVQGEADKGLSELMGQGKRLEAQVDSILQNVSVLSGKQTLQNINTLLGSWRQTSESLNRLINGDLKKAVGNIEEISAKNKKPFHTLLDTLSRNSGNIGKTLHDLRFVSARLDSILTEVNNGNGTLGKLVKKEGLYNNMDSTIAHLDSLILDIKKNPKRYFEVKVF